MLKRKTRDLVFFQSLLIKVLHIVYNLLFPISKKYDEVNWHYSTCFLFMNPRKGKPSLLPCGQALTGIISLSKGADHVNTTTETISHFQAEFETQSSTFHWVDWIRGYEKQNDNCAINCIITKTFVFL